MKPQPCCHDINPDMAARCKSQRGAAAIEFAITLTVLLGLLLGMAGFGFLTWANQRLSAMAGEGARVAMVTSFDSASLQSPASAACTRVTDMKNDSALLSGVNIDCTTSTMPCPWPDVGGGATSCLRVDLTGDVSGWPVLRMLGGAYAMLGGGSSGPEGYRLQTHATIQINQTTPNE